VGRGLKNKGLLLGVAGYLVTYLVYYFGLYFWGWFKFEVRGQTSINAFDYLLIFFGLLIVVVCVHGYGYEEGKKDGKTKSNKTKLE